MTDQGYVTPGLVRWRRATDGPLLVLAIGSLPFLLLEFARDELPYSDRVMLDVVTVLVLVGFALDYLVELMLASNRRRFVRHEWTSLVIVVAQARALLPARAAFGVLRVLRGTRAFRAICRVPCDRDRRCDSSRRSRADPASSGDARAQSRRADMAVISGSVHRRRERRRR